MDAFVHEYFSIERFKKAYAGTFNPMTFKDSWPRVDFSNKLRSPS
jgi:hypothetical protein